jgi:hypothetical protein
VLACGPLGPIPGGGLRGEVHAAPVRDWSFTDAKHTIQLETNPEQPHSVNTWCVGYDGNLYIPTSLILGTKDPSARGWVANVLENPLVRVRIDGRLYELRAVRVSDEQELETVRAKLIAKYDEVEAGEEQAEHAWIFRLESRTGQSAAASGADIGLFEDIGDLPHPITTHSRRAQRCFDQGLTLNFGFNHAAAVPSFREAAGEAEVVYRADLKSYPGNGWALFGLAQSLEAQDRAGEAEIVRVGFANAWRSADVELHSSRF